MESSGALCVIKHAPCAFCVLLGAVKRACVECAPLSGARTPPILESRTDGNAPIGGRHESPPLTWRLLETWTAEQLVS